MTKIEIYSVDYLSVSRWIKKPDYVHKDREGKKINVPNDHRFQKTIIIGSQGRETKIVLHSHKKVYH